MAEIVGSPEGIPDDVLWRYCVSMLAEVAAATSSHDSLVRLDEWMQSDAESRGHAVTIAANAYHGAFVRYCGLVAGALGRHSEAVEDHEAALDQHQRMRAPRLGGAESRTTSHSRSWLAVRPATSSVPAHCSTRSCNAPTSSG